MYLKSLMVTSTDVRMHARTDRWTTDLLWHDILKKKVGVKSIETANLTYCFKYRRNLKTRQKKGTIKQRSPDARSAASDLVLLCFHMPLKDDIQSSLHDSVPSSRVCLYNVWQILKLCKICTCTYLQNISTL